MYNSIGRRAIRLAGRLTGFIAVGLAFHAVNTASALPVIPGATGFGIDTPAGRNGTVYRVTNLNASGAGSLAACTSASGPRVCVFEVSGVIQLTQELMVWNPYLTIAGQTAPAPGIMIRGASLWIAASNVLVQHITIRVGDDEIGPWPTNRDSLNISNGSGPVSNVVIDHCTFSWGLDEVANPGWGEFDNITFMNNIVSEGLNYNVLHDFSGYGPLFGNGAAGNGRVSMTGNLLAHNVARNPFTHAKNFFYANNVVYNHGVEGLVISGSTSGGAWAGPTSTSIVGNLYIRGPSTGGGPDFVMIHQNAVDGSRVYISDNAVLSAYNSPQVPLTDQWGRVAYMSGKTAANFRVDTPSVSVPGFVARPVGAVRTWVLANAGSRPAARSAKDSEIVNDVLNGTGTIKNCVSATRCRAAPYNHDAGGWPVYAKNSRVLSLPADPNGDSDGDGYTNLEEWLHDMAAAVESQSPSPLPPTVITVQ
jgi:hypothetical protein